MATTATRKTLADLHALPEDGRIIELIDGELVVAAAPGEPHLWVVKRLVALLLPFEFEHRLGWLFIAPSEVQLPSGDVVEPDLFFVRRGRESIRRRTHVEGAPDVVFEVSSPSTKHVDIGRKRTLYERFGVSEYWMADPSERKLTALVLRNARYEPLPQFGTIVRSEMLPGFAVDVDGHFEDLP
jgi:Uma2 family endonuclease